MNRNSKKMLKLAVSIGMIVLGVYMTFFRDVGTNKVRNTDLQTEQQGEQHQFPDGADPELADRTG